VTNLLPEDFPLAKKIPFTEKQKVGDSYYEAVVLTNETGITLGGSTMDAFELNPAIAGVVKQISVTPYISVLPSVVPWGVISRSAGAGDKAFFDALETDAQKRLGRSIKDDVLPSMKKRYVAALPRAFAEHAARFYLGPGRDPPRALALARLDLANRNTLEARALAVETAIAAHEPAAACELAPPLAGGTPAQQFMAWRAFSGCKRTDEAAALAARLGIQR